MYTPVYILYQSKDGTWLTSFHCSRLSLSRHEGRLRVRCRRTRPKHSGFFNNAARTNLARVVNVSKRPYESLLSLIFPTLSHALKTRNNDNTRADPIQYNKWLLSDHQRPTLTMHADRTQITIQSKISTNGWHQLTPLKYRANRQVVHVCPRSKIL